MIARSPATASFLGTGWSFPPSFSSGGAEVETVFGAEDVHQSLQILFATSAGERPMEETFGCNLDDVLFEEMDQSLINRVTTLIHDAILEHEPRIELRAVDVAAAGEEGVLQIRIDYEVRETNSRYNMVFPFYLNEAVTPGI
jgi:hypothetical protein